MESGNSNIEALQREIFALDDLYVEYAEYQKKFAKLNMKYQAALSTLRRTREELIDSERLVNQYKAASITLDEYQAITVKLEASQIECNILRDEYNDFVNTAELRYQNCCKEFNEKIQALEGSDTQKCQQQKAGPGRPRGRPSNSAKFQKIFDELNATQANLKAQRDAWKAKSVNLELQNADILNRHDLLFCEVNTLKGQLQERDDKLRCMQLEINSADIQIKELEKEIECFKQRCELKSPGALHEQADELFSEECSVNKDAIEIQEKIGYEVTPVSSDVDEDLYNEAIEDGRSFVVLSRIPHLSPLRLTPEPERDGNKAQHNEDVSKVIPCDGSLQTQNDYIFSSPAPVNQLLHCDNMRPMYTQTDDLKNCTTSTQTSLRNAPLRVNRLSRKITKVRKNLPRKKVNCSTINHMFNCKFCLSKFTRKVIAVNRNICIIKQGDGTQLLIKKIKGTAEKASVGTIKNSEEVDLIREIVEPRSVDSGYMRTDTDGENDGSITVSRQSIPANESALKNKPGSIKKKCQRYVGCAKRKREIRKRKVKCRNCVNNLESDDEFSTTSSLTDYSDSAKGMEKASNALPSAAESKENRHDQQTVEPMSATDADLVLDLSVSKSKFSRPSSITSKQSEVLDLSVSKVKSSTPSFIIGRESEVLDLSVPKNKSSAPSSVVNMITNNHIKSYNDYSMSKPCTIVSTPNVTVDRNEEQIEISRSILNKMERPNNAIVNVSDYSYVSNPKDSESKNQGSTSSSPSETRYEPPQDQLDNCSMDENQQSTPLPRKVSDYKAYIIDSSFSTSTPNSIQSCNKRKMKGSWSSNTSYLNKPGVEIYTAPKSLSLENSKENTTVDNCDFIVPLCSEVTDVDSSNPRGDKLKVLELFGTDSELDTSFQSAIDVSQSPKVKRGCRKVRKDSKKIPKKSLAVGALLGFEDKNYVYYTRLRKRTATAAQKSALVTTLKTNTKSNAGVSNQTLVSKKRAAVAKTKLENGSVMKTRSATRKAGIVKVQDRLMSCILPTCKSHGDQEGSSNCVRNFNSYIADVEDSLRNRETSSAKSIETGRNEDSAPYLRIKRIEHTAKHNKMSESANCKIEIMQQTNELSESSISVVSARLDNHRLENKNDKGIQVSNQELSECSGVINGGELVFSLTQLDLTNIKEHTKLRTTNDNSTTDDLKYGAKGLSIAKQPNSINQNSANIKSPESPSQRSRGDVADNNREYCKNQSSNIFRILKTAADQKEALVKSGRISERPLETDSKRRHSGKRMKSPNGKDVDLPSPEPPHNPRSALGQLESDSQKQQPGKRMKLPNCRNVDLPRPEPPHNKRSALGRLENDSKKAHSVKIIKSPNSGNVDLPRLEPPQNKRSVWGQLESDFQKQHSGTRMKSPNSRDVDLLSPEPSSSHNARSTVGQLESDSQQLHFGKRMNSPNSRDVDSPSPEPTSSHYAQSTLRQLESASQKLQLGKRMKSPNSRDVDLSSPEPSSSHNARSTVGQLESDSQQLHFGKRMNSPNSRDVDLSSPETSSSHNARSTVEQLKSDFQKLYCDKRMKSPNSKDVDLSSPEATSLNARSALGQLESDSQKLDPGTRMKSSNSRDVDLPSPEPSSSHNALSTVRQLESDSQQLHFGKRMNSPNSRDVDLSSPEPSSHNARSTVEQLKSDSQKFYSDKRMKSPNSKDVDLPSPEPSSSHNARSALVQLESDSQKLHLGTRMKSPNSRDVDFPSPEPSSSHNARSALVQLESDSHKLHLGTRMKSPNSRDVDLPSPEPSSSHNARSALVQLESDSQKLHLGTRMKSPNSRDVDLPSPEPSSSHNARSALVQLESDSQKLHLGTRMKSPNSRDVDFPSPEPSSSHNARSALVQLESDSHKLHLGTRMKSPNSRDVDFPSPEPSSSHNARSALVQLESDSHKLHLGTRMKSPNSRDVDFPSPEPSSSHNARSALVQLESDSQKLHLGTRMKSPNSRDVDLPSPEPSSSHNALSTVRQLESDSQQLHFGKRMNSPNSRDVDLSSPEPSSHNARSTVEQLKSDSQKLYSDKRMKSPNSKDVDLPSPEPSSSHNARSALVQLESDSQKLHLGTRMKSRNSRDVDFPSPEPSSSHNTRSALVQLESDSHKLHLGTRMKSPNSRDVDLPSPEPSSSHNARSALVQLESDSQKLHLGTRMKSPNSRDVDLPSPEPPPYKTWSSLGSPRRSSRINDAESSITTDQILNRQKAAEQLASSRVNGGTERMSFKRPLCKKRSRPLESPASPEHPETKDVEPVAPKIIPLERIYGSAVVLLEKPKPKVTQTVTRKAPKMSQGKAKVLLQQMLQFYEDENIKVAVRSFFGHTPTFIVKLVLEQAVADQREELAKRKGTTEPILTIPQQALLKLMVGLDNLGDGQVCRTFLNTVDELLPTITNCAHLCPVTRLYVAICKRSLDMWRIRKALCISFATMGDLAIPFMYIILQSWLEVMPTKESGLHGSLFAKAIVQIVLLKNCAQPVHPYANLHQLLKCYYGYSVEPLNSKELLVELFRNYIVEGNECLGILSMALSKGLDKKWVFEQIDTEIKPQVNASTNINQVCTIVKLVGSMTRYHYVTLDPSVIKSNRQWLEKCCDTPFPDCVRDRAMNALRELPKSVNN